MWRAGEGRWSTIPFFLDSRSAPALLSYLQAHPSLFSYIRWLFVDAVEHADPVGRDACLRLLAAEVRLEVCSVSISLVDVAVLAGYIAESGTGPRTTHISLSLLNGNHFGPGGVMMASVVQQLAVVLAPSLVELELCSIPDALSVPGTVQLPSFPRLRRLTVYDLEPAAVAALVRACAGPLELWASRIDAWTKMLAPADVAKITELAVLGAGDHDEVSAASWRWMTSLKRLICWSDPVVAWEDGSVAAMPPSLSELSIDLLDLSDVDLDDLSEKPALWSIPRLFTFLLDAQWLPSLTVLEVSDPNRTMTILLEGVCSNRGIDLRVTRR